MLTLFPLIVCRTAKVMKQGLCTGQFDISDVKVSRYNAFTSKI